MSGEGMSEETGTSDATTRAVWQLATAAAQWWTERLEQGTPEQRQAFRDVLTVMAASKLAHGRRLVLWTDYDAFDLVALALDKAGLGPGPGRHCMYSAQGVLPMKTHVAIHAGEVTASEGRGGRWHLVAKSWRGVLLTRGSGPHAQDEKDQASKPGTEVWRGQYYDKTTRELGEQEADGEPRVKVLDRVLTVYLQHLTNDSFDPWRALLKVSTHNVGAFVADFPNVERAGDALFTGFGGLVVTNTAAVGGRGNAPDRALDGALARLERRAAVVGLPELGRDLGERVEWPEPPRVRTQAEVDAAEVDAAADSEEGAEP